MGREAMRCDAMQRVRACLCVFRACWLSLPEVLKRQDRLFSLVTDAGILIAAPYVSDGRMTCLRAAWWSNQRYI